MLSAICVCFSIEKKNYDFCLYAPETLIKVNLDDSRTLIEALCRLLAVERSNFVIYIKLNMTLEAIKWENGKLRVLDQTLLPLTTTYIDVKGVEDGWKIINKMQVVKLNF